MEIGDYLTNVLSINDFSSIQYYYLELLASPEAEWTALSNIEATWRLSGALVVTHKSGVWLFGKGGEKDLALPPGLIIDSGGTVEFQGNLLEVKQQGVYEPATSWKNTRSLASTSNANNGAASPSLSQDSGLRNAQALNARASLSNSATSIIKDFAITSSPVKGDAVSADPSFQAQDIQEHFISSVLASLSYHLCSKSGFVALNARTLLLPDSILSVSNEEHDNPNGGMLDGDRIWLVTLGVHLTSRGTLVVTAWPDASSDFARVTGPRQDLGLAKSLVDGATLFLAPSGKVGKYLEPHLSDDLVPAVDANTGSPEKQHISNDSSFGQPLERWKEHCLEWLSRKGINTERLESDPWLTVQIYMETNALTSGGTGEDGLWTPEEKLITITWPALLCFQRPVSDVLISTSPNFSRSYDPLTFAEQWFTTKGEREATISKRQKERDSVAAAAVAQADVDAKTLVPNKTSPMALRRASIVGAVYPTPPDGIQPTVGATPTFDGNASTPGQPNLQPLAPDSEQMVIMKTETEDPDGSIWESNGTKKDLVSSSLDFNDTGNENLFGDLSSDLYGENNVTDEDFSFFDGPGIAVGTEDILGNVGTTFDDAEIRSGTQPSGANNSSVEIPDPEITLDMVMVEPQSEEEQNPEFSSSHPNQILGPSTGKELTAVTKNAHVPKIPSPPLSPDIIFKRLSITGDVLDVARSSNSIGRRASAFESIKFDPSLASFDRKYGVHGRFTYPSQPALMPKQTPAELPNTGYLTKRKKRVSAAVNYLLAQAIATPEVIIVPELDSNDNRSVLDSPQYSHMASPVSDQDDASDTTDEDQITFASRLKRKRGIEDIDDDNGDMAVSFQDLKANHDHVLPTTDYTTLFGQALLDSDPAEWSLASFLSFPEPRRVTSPLSDSEYISSAQVLADQAISRTLHIPLLTNNSLTDTCPSQKVNTRDSTVVANAIHQDLTEVVKVCFDRVTECTMATIIDIQDMQPIGLNNRLPPRPIPLPRGSTLSDPLRPSAIFSIPSPHLEVQRSESKLTVLPSAIPFWDSLGLGPCKGSKDVVAVCIYPDGEGLTDHVSLFLDHIRSAYESNRFGLHERLSHVDLTDGLVPMDFGDGTALSVADHQAILSRIKDTSARVGSLLTSVDTTEVNIVIYYVYDSQSPELLVPICSAFQDIFEVYKSGLAEGKLAVSNELVLQLVPMNFVASHTSLVIPSPSEYARLAMEVYDRCVDVKSGTSISSIILEQPLPRAIDFKITPNPSASLMQENSCIHVAYAQSLDDRWITAAWTDNTGSQQVSASYCLGRRNTVLTTSFSEIAHEIWETTLEVISVQRVNWRIMIAKCGVMDQSEINFWKDLAATESNAQISLTLITVDTNPSIELLPPSVSLNPTTLATQSSLYTTPVSTPQASILSPEQSGNVSTPQRDSGPANAPTPNDNTSDVKVADDATLVDVTDQSWGAILSYRLNNSRSLLEFNPTLVSGYLIKRSGAAPSDAPVVVEVSIVHSEANPRIYDPLLREILYMYRGFSTLARVRGCVDPAKDGRPWHVAAAEKGVQALYMLM